MRQSPNPHVTQSTAIDLLRGLVSISSLSGQEGEASAWLVEQMVQLGYTQAYVDAAGNAVGEMGAPDAERVIVLLGHIDTVPGAIPVRIVNEGGNEVLYGRGSVDAKGPLAAFVAATARLGADWRQNTDIRIVVVGAVEEEAATSKGARFIRDRFDGQSEPIPHACIIGEPSGWSRITLGYKGRILLDLDAAQPMAHTAGPDAGVATVAVDLWNRIAAHAAEYNAPRERAFDQLLPSLRHLHTTTDEAMQDHIAMRVGVRLPLDFDLMEWMSNIVTWTADRIDAQLPASLSSLVQQMQQTSSHPPLQSEPSTNDPAPPLADAIQLAGPQTTVSLRLHGHEAAWRSSRNNALVRSFLAAIRQVEDGTRPRFVSKTGTSDMNVVGPVWGCPIVAYGPGDSALDHTPNEHLQLHEYWFSIRILENVLRIGLQNPM